MSENFYTTSASRARALELDTRPVSVLAFGSQLFSGGVGLNAVLPVYAGANVRCASVPTLLLSNLPHYPSVQTLDIPADWMSRALSDLAATGALTDLRIVAVGYLADPAQAFAIAEWFWGIPDADRPLLILDPTFGDGDVGFYTNPAVVPAIREALVPLARIMTPNAFELQHLVAVSQGCVAPAPGDEVPALATLVRHARSLMAPQASGVVLTGIRDSTGDAAMIGNVVVTRDGEQGYYLPAVPTQSKGLGDLFAAALVTALLADADLPWAVQSAAAHVQQAILEQQRG